MKMLHPTIVHVALLFLSCQANAQLDLRVMIDPSTLKFFDPKSAFNATSDIITEEDGKPVVMPIKVAIMGNLTRLEMGITKVRGGKCTSDEALVAYRKDMTTAGSAESVSIFNPNKKCSYMILPRLKAYLQTPIPEKEMEEIKKRQQAEKMES